VEVVLTNPDPIFAVAK
jgi:hypothetical protein